MIDMSETKSRYIMSQERVQGDIGGTRQQLHCEASGTVGTWVVVTSISEMPRFRSD